VNPRQRRGVLLLVLAAVGAVVVFALVSGYVDDVRKEVEPKTSIIVLGQNVPALQPIPPAALRRKVVPEKYAPARAIREPLAIGNRVAVTNLPAGAELQDGMLTEPPALDKGQQEVSVLISADTGVAGKVQPGDRVDVNATFAGDDRSLPTARKIIVNARVVTVGLPQQGARPFQQGNDSSQANPAANAASEVVPVTFALKPRDVLRLTFAETNAQQIRLSLVRPDDPNEVTRRSREFTLPPSTERPPPR
jgi:pilus assembly protein CpaB